MKASYVLSHILLAITYYNLIAFGFIQIGEIGTVPLYCLFVVMGAFGLGFQVRSVMSVRGDTK